MRKMTSAHQGRLGTKKSIKIRSTMCSLRDLIQKKGKEKMRMKSNEIDGKTEA